MKHAIQVQHLSKSFRFPVKDVSRGWLNNLLNPTEKVVEAVHDVSFTVMPGERVAFIGPNGAGKSTTIKMLTGIIQPTSGKVSVHGFTPQKDRMRLARHIGTVFGQRSQLFPNLPVVESLTFFGIMYGLSTERITARIAELTEQFGLAEFIDQPVRKLSLGQRMRAEVAASLIH
jgi:ABC-2 type transport system ATP-binding protein